VVLFRPHPPTILTLLPLHPTLISLQAPRCCLHTNVSITVIKLARDKRFELVDIGERRLDENYNNRQREEGLESCRPHHSYGFVPWLQYSGKLLLVITYSCRNVVSFGRDVCEVFCNYLRGRHLSRISNSNSCHQIKVQRAPR
jgi:hypothetical protein